MSFKLYVFGIPFVLIILGALVFFFKVKLTEEKHAEIVAELEKTWDEYLGEGETEAVSSQALSVKAPIAGQLISLAEVNDATFASGKLGQGFAIKPSDGRVFAPFDATVRQAFTTRHAVGLVSDDGVVLLIHVGLGTVKLKGTGFVSYVTEGQRVKAGQEILEFWDPTIKKAGLDDTVIVTVTNSDAFKDIDLKLASGTMVSAKDEVLSLQSK